MRIHPRVTVIPVAILLLSGCTASGNLTVPASKMASTAATALLEQTGVDPVLHCGTESVALVVGTTVDCTATDPTTGSVFDAVATISKVDGTEFTVSVKVADTPRGSDSDVPADESAADGPAADVITVPAADIAQVAVGALAPKLGFTPTINCSEGVDLVVGNTVRCMFTADDGTKSTVNIEITKVDGADYSISAVVQ